MDSFDVRLSDAQFVATAPPNMESDLNVCREGAAR